MLTVPPGLGKRFGHGPEGLEHPAGANNRRKIREWGIICAPKAKQGITQKRSIVVQMRYEGNHRTRTYSISL